MWFIFLFKFVVVRDDLGTLGGGSRSGMCPAINSCARVGGGRWAVGVGCSMNEPRGGRPAEADLIFSNDITVKIYIYKSISIYPETSDLTNPVSRGLKGRRENTLCKDEKKLRFLITSSSNINNIDDP